MLQIHVCTLVILNVQQIVVSVIVIQRVKDLVKTILARCFVYQTVNLVVQEQTFLKIAISINFIQIVYFIWSFLDKAVDLQPNRHDNMHKF